jgi:putative peptide zinc metalloprotease protein
MDEMLALQQQRPRRLDQCVVERQQLAADAPVYILKDTAGRRYMKLSEEGLFVWWLMDGEHTIADICRAYVARFRPAPHEALRALARFHEAGFARLEETGPVGHHEAVTPAGRVRSLLSLCTWYCSLPDVDRKVTALYGRVRALYGPLAQAALLVVAGAGMIAFGWHIAANPAWSGGAASRSLLIWLAGFALHVLLHEAAHATTCKHFGREVHRAGLGWYFFAPVAFVDTSDIWAAARLPRILVSVAGPYANLVLSGMAALVALLLAGTVWQEVLWSFSAVGYVLVLVNCNPLLELDGYYVVMDVLEIPNLRARALAHLGAVLRGRQANEPQLRRIFVLFGAASLAYGIAMGIGVLLAYGACIVDFAGSYLPHPYALAVAWGLAGSMSLLILYRLLEGLQPQR